MKAGPTSLNLHQATCSRPWHSCSTTHSTRNT